jgi:hypothetical protein
LKSDDVDHISWLPSTDSPNKVMVLANNKLTLHDISVIQGSNQER